MGRKHLRVLAVSVDLLANEFELHAQPRVEAALVVVPQLRELVPHAHLVALRGRISIGVAIGGSCGVGVSRQGTQHLGALDPVVVYHLDNLAGGQLPSVGELFDELVDGLEHLGLGGRQLVQPLIVPPRVARHARRNGGG
eukprot:5624587-Pleurochrysis_carterae.AAC.10